MTERLSALDASFLVIERRNRPMHVGALMVLDPGPEGFDLPRMLELVRERIHLVPRYRQKVRAVRGHLANPVWVDDPDFDLNYHLQHRSLPGPGRDEELWDLAGRLFSPSLDRSRPLWEGYLIDGLADGRVALLTKSHHCMVDGVSAVEMLSALVDITPDPRRMEPEPWHPDPEPSDAQLLREGLLERAQQPVQAAAAVKDLAVNITASARSAAGTAAGLASSGKRMSLTLAQTPLSTESTPWRRFRGINHSLADYKAIKGRLGGTVNDVAMAVVAGALRTWLINRGEEVADDLTIRIMAPVNVRPPDDKSGGNMVSAMFVDAPVGLADPGARYRDIMAQTRRSKERGEAVAASAMMPAVNFISPNLFAAAVRSVVHTDVLHTVVTNVPGPQFPLFVNGAAVLAMYPFLTTYPGRALTHGVLSYNGGMNWGLIGERDGMYDLAGYADFMDASLAELMALAEQQG